MEEGDAPAADVKEEEQLDADAGPSSAAVKDEGAASADGADDEGHLAGLFSMLELGFSPPTCAESCIQQLVM